MFCRSSTGTNIFETRMPMLLGIFLAHYPKSAMTPIYAAAVMIIVCCNINAFVDICHAFAT